MFVSIFRSVFEGGAAFSSCNARVADPYRRGGTAQSWPNVEFGR
jgi:hypothetical protein